VSRVFPGAVVELGSSQGPIWHDAVGRLTFDEDAPPTTLETIFDLASLTKPLATTTLILDRVARGALRLDGLIRNLLPEWRATDRRAVTIVDLLEHASGLPARLLDRPPTGRRELEHEICQLPLEYTPRTQSIYSDLGFILLGFVLEDLASAEARLTEPSDVRPGAFMRRHLASVAGRLGLTCGLARASGGVFDFGPVRSSDQPIAPTEPLNDDPRRGSRIVGHVHDDYAFLLGGVAGHAGLFGDLGGVSAWAGAFLQASRGHAALEPVLPRDLWMRARRRSEVPGSSRALGWDTMLPSSSCGSRMSTSAFGHVGFTGTSVWIDPPRDRYYVLLTNRACGGGTLAEMREVRRAVHDALADV